MSDRGGARVARPVPAPLPRPTDAARVVAARRMNVAPPRLQYRGPPGVEVAMERAGPLAPLAAGVAGFCTPPKLSALMPRELAPLAAAVAAREEAGSALVEK